jgi:elongation factor G
MTPPTNMFGYVNSLRSFTRAVHSTACSSSFDEVPSNVATELKAKMA